MGSRRLGFTGIPRKSKWGAILVLTSCLPVSVCCLMGFWSLAPLCGKLLLVAFPVSILLSACLLWPERHKLAFPPDLSGKRLIGLAILSACVGLLAGSIGLAMSAGHGNVPAAMSVFSSPGLVFSAVIGVVSVVGFCITLSRLGDLRSHAVSYADLHILANRLIMREVEAAKDGEPARVWIFANAPVFGNVSDRDSVKPMLRSLFDAAITSNLEILIICHDPRDSNGKWYSTPYNDLPDGMSKLPRDLGCYVENLTSINEPVAQTGAPRTEGPVGSPDPGLHEANMAIQGCRTNQNGVCATGSNTPMGAFYRGLGERLGKQEEASVGLAETVHVLYNVLAHVQLGTDVALKDTTRGVWAMVPRLDYRGQGEAGEVQDGEAETALHFVLTRRGCLLFTTLEDLLPRKTRQVSRGSDIGNGAKLAVTQPREQAPVVGFLTADGGVMSRVEEAFRKRQAEHCDKTPISVSATSEHMEARAVD